MENNPNQQKIFWRISFLSGVSSSMGIFPHLLILLLIFVTKSPAPLAFLVPTYLASFFLVEYLFWRMLKKKTPIILGLKQLFSIKEKTISCQLTSLKFCLI